MKRHDWIQDLSSIDNKDDKSEIANLLEKLDNRERIAFVQWIVSRFNNAASQHNESVKSGKKKGKPVGTIVVENQSGTSKETFADILMLSVQFGIPIDSILVNLEKLVQFKTALIPSQRSHLTPVISDKFLEKL